MKRSDNVKLNKLITKLGNEAYTLSDDGTPLTRFEALAKLVWDMALGYKTKDPKTDVETIHFPDKSFITMIYDRMEGKVPLATSVKGDKDRVSAAKKVSEQTKSRLNDLAK